MTEPLPFVFQRTPTQSPERIFAPPITPIVIDSSPLTIPSLPDLSSISRTVRHTFPDSPSVISPNGCNDTTLRTPNKRGALSRNISKENVAMTPGRVTDKSGKSNGEILPASGSCSPTKLDSQANENGQQRSAKGPPSKAGRTRKTGPKKSTNTLNKMIKGRVTKSSESSQSSTKSTKDISRFPSPERKAARGRENEIKDLNLEEALRRRTDWTPTKDTFVSTIDLTQTPSTSEAVVEKQFGNLVERYGYIRESSQEGDSDVVHPVPTKKRRLELVGTSGRDSTSGDSTTTDEKRTTSTKAKKPRKAKTTTITGLTTAQYETNSASDTNFHNYFCPKAATMQRKPRARKSTSKAKGRGAREASPAFKVAPATDALKSLDDQVFLFGTHSQLARDFSPEHEEQEVRESSAQSSAILNVAASTSRLSSLLSSRSGSKSLWGASARDLDGGLADIEIVDLQKPSTSNVDQPLHEEIQTTGQSEDNFMDVDHFCKNSASRHASPEGSTGTTSIDMKDVEQNKNDQHSQRSSSAVPKRNSRGSREGSLKASETVVDLVEEAERGKSSSLPSPGQAGPVQPELPVDDMPHFRGFSTAELNKQAAAYGFKPVKTRDAAISLLEKCWESRNKTSNTSAVPSTRKITAKPAAKAGVSKASASGSSKLKKGRSSKSSQSSKRPDPEHSVSASLMSSFEEIADSTDEDAIPTPSHDIYYDALSYSNQMTQTPPSTLTIRPQRQAQSPHNNADEAPDIHKQITLAIKRQPRMDAVNGIKQPTWYEKILMYDPILLDDLTVWLNTEGLNRVGEDREVDRLTVREWCESKGVCCTWRKAGHRRK